MLKVKIFILSFVVFTQINVFAQKFPFYSNFKWENTPVLNDRDIKNINYYYNEKNLAVEYIFDENRGQYYKYETHHYRVFLNSDAAVETFNKVYVSLENVTNFFNLKVRLIKKSGVVDVKPKIEEYYNESESEQYNYFAIAGIEKGDEIEIVYTVKKYPELNGDQFFFQDDIPIFNSKFYFIVPKFTEFKFKAYNGMPTPTKIDTIIQITQYYAQMDTIPAFKSEYYSEYANSIYKVNVALSAIKENNKFVKFSPFETFGGYINEYYNRPIKGKDEKILKNLVSELKLDEIDKEEDKIRKIENYIKFNMNFSSYYPDLGIGKAIQDKVTSGIGLVYLFKNIFDEANIEYELGLTSGRYDTAFDPDFESNFFLKNYIFYFPDVNLFMAPLDYKSRLGYINPEWVPNHGLLIKFKTKPFRDFSYKVREIPYINHKKNSDSIIINLYLDKELIEFEMDVERHVLGYEVGETQVYYKMYRPETRESKIKDLLQVVSDRNSFDILEVKNAEAEDAYLKPLIIKGKSTIMNSYFIDKANDKTIIKLGNVFSGGVDIKEIDKKKTDFTFLKAFSRSYTIHIHLPDNIKDVVYVNIPVIESINDLEGHELISKIEKNGNKLTYTYYEVYKKQKYSINEREKLREVFDYYKNRVDMNIILSE